MTSFPPRTHRRIDITVRRREDHDTVSLAGEIDLASAPELHAVVAALLAAGRRHIMIDLDDVTFMDGAALGELISSDRDVRHAGGSLEVTKHAACQRLLKITGETGRLQISTHPAAAQVDIRGRAPFSDTTV